MRDSQLKPDLTILNISMLMLMFDLTEHFRTDVCDKYHSLSFVYPGQ